MKPVTLLVSALATLAAAAPTATTDVDKRSFAFDINALNGLKSFNQVNLNYLLNINSLQLGLLGNLADVNNFNVLQFQNLFQAQAFDVQALLQLQSLHTLLQFHQLGVLSGFDLAGLQLQHLNLGLINNVGLLDLQQFISPNVVGQVQTVASQPSLSFDPNLVASDPGVDTSNNVASSGGDTSNVVTAAEQEAQEGRSSLN
ncbi:FAS1 domain-containing protein [Madurella fahalii]|uniref:FAS1 domain-containing protein n=1 Tax=Madurella fahalii TaxID=1157608 RepID=A0ABQ0GMC0_9PEZI